MPDDYGREYLEHRSIAEQENSVLADFLRKNSGDYVKPETVANTPVKPTGESSSEIPPTKESKPSMTGKILDYTAFMLRPLGALQEAAIAPIAHEFSADTELGKIPEAFSVSAKAFGEALFPKPPGAEDTGRPQYEKKIIEEEFPNLPESFKPAAETFLGLVTDPAILAFPFMKSVRKGLELSAAQGTEATPWTNAVKEAVSIGPTKADDVDTTRLIKLAKKADAGDAVAARKIAEEITGEQEASRQLEEIIGKPPNPRITMVSPELATSFLDITETDLPKRAININLSRVNSTDDVSALIDDTAKLFREDINESRRGVQTNKATEALAAEMNLHPTELLSRRKGQAFNAEEALAARQILISSAETLKSMADKVLTPNAGSLEKIAFRKQLSLHKAIQEQVSGLTAEAGRALQQFRIGAESTKLQLAQIRDLTKNMSDAGDFTDDMARAISDMRSPAQIARFAKDINKATTKDVFFEVWINSLLSGPQTQVVNAVSNSLTAFWQIPERLAAAGIGKILNTGDDAVRATEAVGQAYGMIEGMKDGVKAFARTFITEDPGDIVSKLERPMSAAISADALGVSGMAGRAVDWIGRGVRLPGTLLSSTDAFFKSVGYRMELQARAYRTIAQEGLTGNEAGMRLQNIINNPPPDIHLAAIDASRYQTFTQPLGETGRAYQHMVASTPVLKVVTPFVRTPTNIFKYFVERSPFAPLVKGFRADIKAGGATRDMALARIGLGSSVMAIAAVAASEGKITGGGPTDQNLRNMKRATGWQPYSIKTEDGYVSYERLEPFGTLLGVAADFSEIAGEIGDSESQEIVAHLAMSVAKNATSKTYMRGLSEAINALDDPVRYGEQWWGNLMQTVVPTGVAQIARTGIPGVVEGDPILRETRSVMDRIRSRVPGYSKDLPPRMNFWADPIELSGGLGPDMISPLYFSQKKKDPVSDEFVRLQIPVTMPEKTIGGIELSAKQYGRLLILTSKEPVQEGRPNLKQALFEQMKDPDYKKLTDGVDGGKAFVLQKMINIYKKAARDKLLQEDTELSDRVMANQTREYFEER